MCVRRCRTRPSYPKSSDRPSPRPGHFPVALCPGRRVRIRQVSLDEIREAAYAPARHSFSQTVSDINRLLCPASLSNDDQDSADIPQQAVISHTPSGMPPSAAAALQSGHQAKPAQFPPPCPSMRWWIQTIQPSGAQQAQVDGSRLPDRSELATKPRPLPDDSQANPALREVVINPRHTDLGITHQRRHALVAGPAVALPANATGRIMPRKTLTDGAPDRHRATTRAGHLKQECWPFRPPWRFFRSPCRPLLP